MKTTRTDSELLELYRQAAANFWFSQGWREKREEQGRSLEGLLEEVHSAWATMRLLYQELELQCPKRFAEARATWLRVVAESAYERGRASAGLGQIAPCTRASHLGREPFP